MDCVRILFLVLAIASGLLLLARLAARRFYKGKGLSFPVVVPSVVFAVFTILWVLTKLF